MIKISVLKNCADDPRELASIIAERTPVSQVVQVIGKKNRFCIREEKTIKRKLNCQNNNCAREVII